MSFPLKADPAAPQQEVAVDRPPTTRLMKTLYALVGALVILAAWVGYAYNWPAPELADIAAIQEEMTVLRPGEESPTPPLEWDGYLNYAKRQTVGAGEAVASNVLRPTARGAGWLWDSGVELAVEHWPDAVKATALSLLLFCVAVYRNMKSGMEFWPAVYAAVAVVFGKRSTTSEEAKAAPKKVVAQTAQQLVVAAPAPRMLSLAEREKRGEDAATLMLRIAGLEVDMRGAQTMLAACSATVQKRAEAVRTAAALFAEAMDAYSQSISEQRGANGSVQRIHNSLLRLEGEYEDAKADALGEIA